MTTFTYKGYFTTFNPNGSAATLKVTTLEVVVASKDATMRYIRVPGEEEITLVSEILTLRIDGRTISPPSSVDAYTNQLSWGQNSVSNVFTVELAGGEFVMQVSGNPIPEFNSAADYNAFVATLKNAKPLTFGFYGPDTDIPYTEIMTPSVTENDLIRGGNKTDTFDGGIGNDKIYGLGGNDKLFGGAGKDQLFGDNGNDVLVGGAGADKLNGGSGKDTASYEDAKKGVTASLQKPGQNKGDAKGDTFSSIENLTGSKKADKLTGDNKANVIKGGSGNDTLSGLDGNDRLEGGNGNDTLVGGKGKDTLIGGKGADTFAFKSVSDSTNNAKARDIIQDFKRGQKDKIDLGAIDARSGTTKNDAFKFIGEDAFSGKKGELRYEKKSGNTFVYGDVDGDGKIDLAIQIKGSINLTDKDFVL